MNSINSRYLRDVPGAPDSNASWLEPDLSTDGQSTDGQVPDRFNYGQHVSFASVVDLNPEAGNHDVDMTNPVEMTG